MEQVKVYYKKGHDENGAVLDLQSGRLEELQKLVGGRIESAFLSIDLDERNIVLFCNEEGKIRHLPVHLWLYNKLDFVAGPMIFVKYDDEGEIISLDDNEVKLIEYEILMHVMSCSERERANRWIANEF